MAVIKFLWKDIKSDYARFVIMLIQMIITSIVLCYCISECIDAYKMTSQITHFSNAKCIVKLFENLDSQEFDEIINDKNANEQMALLFDDLDNDDDLTTLLIQNTTSVVIDLDDNMLNQSITSIAEEDMKDNYSNKGIACFRRVEVNSTFFSFFDIKTEVMPHNLNGVKGVILGADYKKYLKVGDTFFDIYGDQYEVMGFLSKGAFYTNPYESDNTKCLDNYIITAENSENDEYMLKLLYTYIIVNDDSQISEIENRISKYGVGWFSVADYSTQVKIIIKEIENQLLTIISSLLLIAVFASIGMISTTLNFIDDHLYELVIFRLCGTRRRDLIIRLSFPVIICVLASIIVAVMVFGGGYPIIVDTLIMTLQGFAIMVYPIKVFCNISINEELRQRN